MDDEDIGTGAFVRRGTMANVSALVGTCSKVVMFIVTQSLSDNPYIGDTMYC